MTIPFIDHGALPEFAGTRCILRPLKTEDVSGNYVAWLNDSAINQFLESRFSHHTIESVREFVAAQLASGSNCFYGIWAPIDNSDLEHVGNIKLGPIDRHHLSADLGFLVGERRCWGRGIASEAIKMMLALGESLGLRKITAGAYEDNHGSAKALVNAGFSEEGLRPSQLVYGGRRVGQRLFGYICC